MVREVVLVEQRVRKSWEGDKVSEVERNELKRAKDRSGNHIHRNRITFLL